MNPFPADLGDVVRRYPKIFVPEINLGQLSQLVRAEYLVDAQSYRQDVRRARSAPPSSKQQILEMIDE